MYFGLNDPSVSKEITNHLLNGWKKKAKFSLEIQPFNRIFIPIDNQRLCQTQRSIYWPILICYSTYFLDWQRIYAI